MQEIEENGIKIYPLPDCDSDEDEDYKEQVRQLKEAVPFAVCGANTLLEVKGRKVRGRLYPWGVVEVENPEHCDFIKLRTMLITHMQDLQEVTQEVHYENYRSERLAKGIKQNGSHNKSNGDDQPTNLTEKDRILLEKEAELRRMTEMLAQMQAKMRAQQ
jgi:septin 2